VLRRVKRQVLAMLASPVKDGRTCAWLRSRRARKCAALLTRLARRGRQDVSGRGAPRHIDARSPRGVEQGGMDWVFRFWRVRLGDPGEAAQIPQLTNPIQDSGHSPWLGRLTHLINLIQRTERTTG